MEGSFFGFPGHGQKTVRQQKRMGGQGFTVSKIKKENIIDALRDDMT